jgi:hypothetical protein
MSHSLSCLRTVGCRTATARAADSRGEARPLPDFDDSSSGDDEGDQADEWDDCDSWPPDDLDLELDHEPEPEPGDFWMPDDDEE